jgi:hypothetical protein
MSSSSHVHAVNTTTPRQPKPGTQSTLPHTRFSPDDAYKQSLTHTHLPWRVIVIEDSP